MAAAMALPFITKGRKRTISIVGKVEQLGTKLRVLLSLSYLEIASSEQNLHRGDLPVLGTKRSSTGPYLL